MVFVLIMCLIHAAQNVIELSNCIWFVAYGFWSFGATFQIYLNTILKLQLNLEAVCSLWLDLGNIYGSCYLIWERFVVLNSRFCRVICDWIWANCLIHYASRGKTVVFRFRYVVMKCTWYYSFTLSLSRPLSFSILFLWQQLQILFAPFFYSQW